MSLATTAKSQEVKTALVTGGARGLGLEFSRRLAGLGMNVAMVDLDLNGAQKFPEEAETMVGATVEEEVRRFDVEAIAHQADAADWEGMRGIVADVLARWGRLDVVICNAGGGVEGLGGGLPSELDAERLMAILQRNLVSTVATCVAAAPAMCERGEGTIITLTSHAGLAVTPDPVYADYAASKAAVAIYTRYLAQELGPHGITVNSIAPGYIATGRVGAGLRAAGIEKFEQQAALRRVGEPRQIADLVEFLVGDHARFITGQVIGVDGGVLRGPS
ncbi:MAG: SDR family oxidoreductase [Solirubrobacterales bacterium]